MSDYILLWLVCGVLADVLAMFVMSRKTGSYDWLEEFKDAPIVAHVLLVLIPPSILLLFIEG